MTQVLNSNPQSPIPQVSVGPARKESSTPGALTVRWIDSVDELEAIKRQWDALAEDSIYPNPMFEHNFLIPAFKHLGNEDIRVLVVEETNSSTITEETKLLGLMPLVKKKFYHLPIPCLEVWKHDLCFDTTPLIGKTCPVQTLESVFDFLAEQKIGLLSLDTISAEPELQSVLEDALEGIGRSLFQRASFARSALRPKNNSAEYLQEFVSKNLRKKVRRLERRLSELGEVSYELSNEFSDYNELAQQFLEIESSGWKHEAGTALKCHSSTTKFYEELIFQSAQHGKARFLSLKLDGQSIVMLSDFQSGKKVFSFKTGYDERFGAFSPGLLIELKNIECLHKSGIELADSCTQPGNATISRTWGQQLKFQHVVIGLRPGIAQFATRLMPWIQSAADRIRQVRQ